MQCRIHIILALLFNLGFLYPQDEANIWYFGDYAGVDFNSGEPVPVAGFYPQHVSCSNMCDTSGNFLFACDGEKVYNRNKEVMLNGHLIDLYSEGTLIVKKPGTNPLYYIFTTHHWNDGSPDYGLYYSVVDMQLDDGLGGVTDEKDILLEDAWDATEKICAIRHENKKDIWIITRNLHEDRYTAFLLTESGLNTNGVFSPAIDRTNEHVAGEIGISHDKKHLVAAYEATPITNRRGFEVCNFSASTGEIDLLYTLVFRYGEHHLRRRPWAVEFSPDSKYLYLSVQSPDDYGIYEDIHQLDIQYYSDSAMFYDSSVIVATGPAKYMQLARDGRIYCSDSQDEYLSVIQKPWMQGDACNFETDYVYLDIDDQDRRTSIYFPNMLLNYLYRFEWEGHCSGYPVQFRSNFIPEPHYIQWHFDDPDSGADSISYDLNPVHHFSKGGEFEVSVFVRYPNNRIEKTSRVVTITQSPVPHLGPDTLKCLQDEITLHAGNDEGMYAWSTGDFGTDLFEITVSDTGWYWVQVTNVESCAGTDSIYVGQYPPPLISEDSLVITPTSCGGSNGKITGLQLVGEEPLSFAWYDADSNLLSDSLDIEGLAVGNYFLHIYDGFGCTIISDPYTVTDAGDIQITEVLAGNAHCWLDDGHIEITAWSGASDEFLYSIDNGNSWQTGNNIFTGLSPGNYFIRVKDQSDCETVYEDNPVTIENTPGPEVTDVTTTPEIDYLANGQIDITAFTGEGQLHYSIDNGTTFQTANGLFTNLTAGAYYCMVKDDFGCDTSFIVEVERTISQLIEALAGSDTTCIGDAAVVPLVLDNFSNIIKFHLTLAYDTAHLTCDNYYRVHPDLEAGLQVSIVPSLGRAVISWEGNQPVTLGENTTIIDLVFNPRIEAYTDVDWVTGGGESVFYNENMEEVGGSYQLGKVRIYAALEIFMGDKEEVCEGENTHLIPFVSGGSGNHSYEWTGPGGYYSNELALNIDNTLQENAGEYLFVVKDAAGCEMINPVNLIVHPKPQIAFAGFDTLFVDPGFILEAGSGYESYLWSTGDSTDAIQVNTEGLYSVFVTSTESCEATDSVTVLWDGEPFWLPTAFSPNNDGLNDEFKPVRRYDYVQSYHLSVYSRWGELIFETNDIEEGWDGQYKGQLAQQGTYVYRIVYTAHSTGPDSQTKTGYFSLVR